DNRDAEPECVGPCGDGQRCREPRRSEPVSSSYCTSSSSSDRLVLLRFFRRSESAVQFRWLYFRMERSELRTLCSLRTSEISVVSWVAVFFDRPSSEPVDCAVSIAVLKSSNDTPAWPRAFLTPSIALSMSRQESLSPLLGAASCSFPTESCASSRFFISENSMPRRSRQECLYRVQ